MVNSEVRDGWVTPCTITLPAGKYRLSVVDDGLETWLQEVEVTAGGERTVNAQLLPVMGGPLHIETEPPGLEVLVDGEARGASPVTLPLRAGPHIYKVMPPPGRAAVEKTVRITADDASVVRIRY